MSQPANTAEAAERQAMATLTSLADAGLLDEKDRSLPPPMEYIVADLEEMWEDLLCPVDESAWRRTRHGMVKA